MTAIIVIAVIAMALMFILGACSGSAQMHPPVLECFVAFMLLCLGGYGASFLTVALP